MPQLRHKHKGTRRKIGRKRFPNKAIKVEERAYKQVRQLEDTLAESPMPSIILDLGIDKVSQLIKSITRVDDDAFQKAWLAVIEDHVASEEDILRTTKEVYHAHINEAIAKEHKEISLDEPIGEHRDEGDFTLKDILKSPAPRTDEEIDHEIDANTCYVANSSGKRQASDRWYLDPDVKAELKRLYPHDILKVAIRKVVGMPMAERQKRGWYKWEDAIIRQRYPWGGARACALDICRSLTVINSRARLLGVKADTLNSYKPCPEWLNIPELAEGLGCKYGVAARLEKTGKIKAIRIPGYHQGHDGVFFTPEAIDDYLNHKEVHRAEVARRRATRVTATTKAKRITRIEEANIKLRADNSSLRVTCRKLQGQIKVGFRKEHKKLERHQKRLQTREGIIQQQKEANATKQRELREQKTALRQQQKEANAIMRKGQTLVDRYISIRPEWRRICAERSRLQSYAAQLELETQRVNHAWQNFQETKGWDIDKALAKLRAGQRITATTGHKIHYVFLDQYDCVAKACHPTYRIPIDTFRQVGYDPFVDKAPTCKVCLSIKQYETTITIRTAEGKH